MTEAEILEQIATHGDRIWSTVQYWTSVSFAILIAGHFVADRIHWLALAWFGLLYIAFTMNFVNMVEFDSQVIRAGLAQLQDMAVEGQELGLVGQAFVTHGPLSNVTPVMQIARLSMSLGLFLSTLGYPAYCHIKARRTAT